MHKHSSHILFKGGNNIPRLSIIVPVYQVADYIDSCMESILQQTFTDFEVILIDDGSTDGSGQRCDFYQADNVVVVHQKNQGLSAARNTGMSLAKGEYITFVDPDDYIKSDYYEYLLHHMEQYNAQIGICLFQVINKPAMPDSKEFIMLDNDQAIFELIIQQRFNHCVCSKVFRRTVIHDVSFAVGYTCEDTLFCFEAFQRADRILFCPVYKYFYRPRPNSITTSEFSFKKFDLLILMGYIEKKIIDEYPRYFSLYQLRMLDTYLEYIYTMTKQNICKAYKQYYKTVKRKALSTLLPLISKKLLSIRETVRIMLFILFTYLYVNLLGIKKKQIYNGFHTRPPEWYVCLIDNL